MLRPFSLVSDFITYTGDVAEFQFPTTPKGAARCAIVGIRYVTTGDAGTVETNEGYGTTLERLTVAGRNYTQGPILLPLIAAAMVPGGAGLPIGFPNFSRFPGSRIPLPYGAAGGPMAGAGMALGPGDEVRVRLARLAPNAFVNRMVLDCVQWPDDQRDPSHAIWEALRFQGIGEATFVGNRLTGWPGAGVSRQFEVLPQPPAARTLRRQGFRAAMTTDTGNPLGTELGDPASETLANVEAQIWTSFQRAPQNDGAPLRTIMGLPNMEIMTGLVDMQENERSIARLDFIGTAPPAADRLLYIVHMFEGRDPAAPTLEAANAIS
jgi:hypothetical protein